MLCITWNTLASLDSYNSPCHQPWDSFLISTHVWIVASLVSCWHHQLNTTQTELMFLGKYTQEHPRNNAYSSMSLLITREVEAVCRASWARGTFPFFVGSERKISRILLHASPYPPSTQFVHPLISLRGLLCFVYILGDKTQTRNGNERKSVRRIWLWGAVLEAVSYNSCTCIWHLAICRLFGLCFVRIPRGWFILTWETMVSLMPSFYSAKTQEKREVDCFFDFLKQCFLPPTLRSCIAGNEIFLWETLHSWHNSTVFTPGFPATFFSPFFSQFRASSIRLLAQLKPMEKEKLGLKALITLLGSSANKKRGSALCHEFQF